MPNPGNNCYILPVLEPLSSYEVRVSYVGAIPAIYTLSFACQNDRGSNQPFQHQQRELLDTSKLIFSTDHHGLPTNSGCQRVCVYGRYDSAPIKDSAVPAVLHYTIILESLAFNVLPSSLIGVVMFILFLLVASQFWVAPLLINFIRKFPDVHAGNYPAPIVDRVSRKKETKNTECLLGTAQSST
eukprot:gene9326-1593_t